MHVPKTAGATLSSMLRRAYGDHGVVGAGNYLREPELTRRRASRARLRGDWAGTPVVVGHVPYGVFRRYLPSDTRYITILRDPLERVLSHYHRHLAARSRTPGSLDDALKAQMPEITNLATRMLCDRYTSERLASSALEEAKSNLTQFAFAGIQERFDESVVLLQQLLGLGQVPFINQHVSVERPASADLSARQRALVESANELDLELYGFAAALFDEALDAAAGDEFSEQLDRVRSISRDENAAAIEAAEVWLERELPVGVVKPKRALYAAAESDGIDREAVRHVMARAEIRKGRDASGRKGIRRR